MTDRAGDPAKQPPECKSIFTPFGPDNPRLPGESGTGRWSQCPNIKEVGGGMEGERYYCVVCGESYFLDYEEMR